MKILIGPENVSEALKDTSVVVASYDIGDDMRGLIGVVGPTRMDYATVAARLSGFAEGLTRMFGKQDRRSTPEGGTQRNERRDQAATRAGDQQKAPGGRPGQEAQEPQTERRRPQRAPEKGPNAKEQRRKRRRPITFTREQMEKMELAAKQLESVKDQFVRLTAEYDNYRKRTAKEKESHLPGRQGGHHPGVPGGV